MRFKWWHAGLMVALTVALLSPLASSSPDGLERVAMDNGFMEAARTAVYHLIPNYMFPGIQNQALATIAAGVVGTLIVFGVGYGVAWILRSRERSRI